MESGAERHLTLVRGWAVGRSKIRLPGNTQGVRWVC